MKNLRKFYILLLPVCMAALLSSCTPTSPLTGGEEEPMSRTAFYFDTVVTISIYDRMGRDAAEAILDRCMEMAARYDDKLLSAHSEDSEIWRLNHAGEASGSSAGSRALTVDSEVAALLALALDWSERTDGAFLPTMGALSGLWRFNEDPPGPVPDAADIEEARRHISPALVRVAHGGDGAPLVRIDDPVLQLDLGGIAKGYIADQMKSYLVRKGVASAVINLGGNVLLVGEKPDGSAFKVGIQNPDSGRTASDSLLLTLEARDKSIVTSGVYERYFEEDGVRYHHVLDPATGYPADSGLAAVTILSANSVTGDALSTACLVMGQKRGQALVESLPDVEALFVAADGGMTATAGFPY